MRQRRQSPAQLLWEDFDALLQPWWKRTISLELPLKAGRQLAVALRQPRREIGVPGPVIATDDVTVARAKDWRSRAAG